MVVRISIILLPLIFVAQLLIIEYILYRKGVSQDGASPINKYLFFSSKYVVVLLWTGMVLSTWNIHFPGSLVRNEYLQTTAIFIFIIGFCFFYAGRISLGSSFRVGIANEKTAFVAKGVYKISRNPMYLGLNLTIVGCLLYSLNIYFILVSAALLTINHMVTLAEERKLIEIYGDGYESYCMNVRRYL